jgi:hypothetical protein
MAIPAMELPEWLSRLLVMMAWLSLFAMLAALVLLGLLWRRLRRVEVAPGTGFWDTLRQVPLGLPVLLDLLDLSLDVLSAPIIWFLLDRLRLRQLRDVASVEALVPFTGPLPLLTICWVLARFGFGGRGAAVPGSGRLLEGEQVEPGKWRPKA